MAKDKIEVADDRFSEGRRRCHETWIVTGSEWLTKHGGPWLAD